MKYKTQLQLELRTRIVCALCFTCQHSCVGLYFTAKLKVPQCCNVMKGLSQNFDDEIRNLKGIVNFRKMLLCWK